MVLGISLGLVISPHGGGLLAAGRVDSVASWLALSGQLFLAIIQMVVIPLVVASIVLDSPNAPGGSCHGSSPGLGQRSPTAYPMSVRMNST